MSLPVAIVGGGISGIACAAALISRDVPVTIFDRGYRVGGRLATQTLRDTGTSWDGRVVDVGASYFTAHNDQFRAVVDLLEEQGVLRQWTDTIHVGDATGIIGPKLGPMRFSAPAGLQSMVQALADQLPDELVTFQHQVDVSDIDVSAGALVIRGEQFGAAALCAPDPQLLTMLDRPVMQPVRELLADSSMWEPVLALITVYNEVCWPEFDGIFVNDDAVITFIANDGSRRGDASPVLVTHSTAPVAAAHLTAPLTAAPVMMAALAEVVKPACMPQWFNVKRWTYARPLNGRSEPFGIAMVANALSVGVAGDSWAGGPRTEAAWVSGSELGRALALLR